jgi:hypothetical protein
MTNRKPTILEAILSLSPGAQVATVERSETDFDINWISPSTAPVTKQQILAEVARLTTVWEGFEYQRQRAEAYPSIEEQLDTLYHGGLDAWKAQVKAVKDEFPK